MSSRDVSGFLAFSFVLALLLLLVFGILQWLHIPSGSFLDWLIGIASFWWLLVIVTIPWNIHFAAKGVLIEGAESRKKGITVDAQQMHYVERVAKRALWSAIALHTLSALVLYGLAATGISTIGYIGAIATLLMTGLRPAISLCQYLIDRLQSIHRVINYPREDILELRQRFETLESQVRQVEYHLNLNLVDGVDHPDSWATNQQRTLAALRQDLTGVGAGLEDLRRTNQAEHDQLSREARNAIAQLSTDGQFLEHVREIIRFFKAA